LQAAQGRFSLPCGQGLHSAQSYFTLPCGHLFRPPITVCQPRASRVTPAVLPRHRQVRGEISSEKT
jgi:hypothetical protein